MFYVLLFMLIYKNEHNGPFVSSRQRRRSRSQGTVAEETEVVECKLEGARVPSQSVRVLHQSIVSLELGVV